MEGREGNSVLAGLRGGQTYTCENISFPHPSDAGVNDSESNYCIIYSLQDWTTDGGWFVFRSKQTKTVRITQARYNHNHSGSCGQSAGESSFTVQGSEYQYCAANLYHKKTCK